MWLPFRFYNSGEVYRRAASMVAVKREGDAPLMLLYAGQPVRTYAAPPAGSEVISRIFALITHYCTGDVAHVEEGREVERPDAGVKAPSHTI